MLVLESFGHLHSFRLQKDPSPPVRIQLGTKKLDIFRVTKSAAATQAAAPFGTSHPTFIVSVVGGSPSCGYIPETLFPILLYESHLETQLVC